MRHRSISALITGLWLLLPAPLAAQRVDTTAVDRIFGELATDQTPGCAVAVGRDGRTVLARAYGMADLERGVRNTPTTIFEAGSVSKQFTAGAAILLAVQGRLSLDDDVRRYIPELPDYGAPITIRHLIHHTSGLRDWGEVSSIAGWPRTRRAYTNAHALDIIVRQRALNHEPGADYSYTNSGYNLLTAVVERVSGESLAEFTRRNFFEPLGMKNTSWRDDFTRIVPGRAMAYRTVRNGYSILMPFEDVHGHAGLLTTVEDLLLWTENLETGKVGGREWAEEMHRVGRLNDGREIEYAGGIQIGRYRGLREVHHSGLTAGYRSYLTRFPEARLSVAVLCNANGTNPRQLARQTADLFLADLPSVASAPRRAAQPQAQERRQQPAYRPTAAELAGYVGEYHSDEAEVSYTVEVAGDVVRIRRRPGVTYRLTPTGKDEFRSSNGWTIRFRRDDAGRVTGFSVGTSRVWDLAFTRVEAR